MRLTEDDHRTLERSYIDRPTALAAGLYRVPSIEGRDIVGRKDGGNYAGVVYPNRLPGSSDVIGERLRLDEPPIDLRTGKPEHKYLTPPGARNRIYMPLEDPALAGDVAVPVVITEGEKKYLALHRAALQAAAMQNGNGAGGSLPFVSMSLYGVWAWRGIVGMTSDARGQRVEVKGVIPDFDRIPWDQRKVIIAFDSNTATNESVRAARAQLARELESRGAVVWFLDVPARYSAAGQAVPVDINGLDDLLGAAGLVPFLELLRLAGRYQWHDELARSDKGKILPGINNLLLALRLAPEWHSVIAFNEFSLAVEARRATPWGARPRTWDDVLDIETAAWCERKGLRVSDLTAGKAVEVVSRDHPFHPVREYLDRLQWDGVGRIDDWLTLYLGVKPDDYTRAVGACWLKSAVARIRQPGCQADGVLILEGPQGTGKSSALAVIGGEFYSDDIPELGTRDAAMGAHGVWIVELAELAAMGRAEIEKIKSFLSRRTDRYRPPYGHHVIEAPRQSIFGGSVNLNKYLKDETGGRRFWPVSCGRINLDALRRDRDQLWAESQARYAKNEKWWLDTSDLNRAAGEVQEERYQSDPWEELIEKWLLGQVEVTTADVLANAIKRDAGQWTRSDETRIGIILNRLDWVAVSRPSAGTRRRLYRPKPNP